MWHSLFVSVLFRDEVFIYISIYTCDEYNSTADVIEKGQGKKRQGIRLGLEQLFVYCI